MSLIVAKLTEHGIYIVSDSKITKDFERINPLINGISKIFLLDYERCIAFSGNVEQAIETIAQLHPQDSTQRIADTLRAVSARGDVSFLVACLKPDRQLIVIRNGSALVTSEGWIGDYAAYSVYKDFFDRRREPSQIYDVTFGTLRLPEDVPEQCSQIYGSMYRCMAAAIDSGESESIGGFVVPVLSEQNRFWFGCYSASFRKPIDPDLEQIGSEWRQLQLGDVTTGAFSFVFAHVGNGFAVHISQCNIGILYEARGTPVLERNLKKDIDEIDFVKSLESRYGSWRGPLCAHQPNHFWQKAEKLAILGILADAVDLFSEGIKWSSLEWKHKSQTLHIRYESLRSCLDSEGSVEVPIDSVRSLKYAFLTRGKCRYHLKQYSDALQDFNDALLLDPTFSESLSCKEALLKILDAPT